MTSYIFYDYDTREYTVTCPVHGWMVTHMQLAETAADMHDQCVARPPSRWRRAVWWISGAWWDLRYLGARLLWPGIEEWRQDAAALRMSDAMRSVERLR